MQSRNQTHSPAKPPIKSQSEPQGLQGNFKIIVQINMLVYNYVLILINKLNK